MSDQFATETSEVPASQDATAAGGGVVAGRIDATALARATRRAVTRALAEDLGDRGDATTRLAVPATSVGEAEIVARQDGVVSGLAAVVETFTSVDSRVTVEVQVADGDHVIADQVVAVATGPVRSLLSAERTALNFLGRLSGIATHTARMQELLDGTGCVVRDTRKTTPGLRLLEKAAVADGGGENHRIGLFDGILVKENHIAAAGDLMAAVSAVLAGAGDLAVQVEVESVDQLWKLLELGVTDILLDNFSVDQVRHAASRVDGRAQLEVSGNVTADTIRDYAEAVGPGGRIAVGALTHSAPSFDVSMDIVSIERTTAPRLSRPAATPATSPATAAAPASGNATPTSSNEVPDLFAERPSEPQVPAADASIATDDGEAAELEPLGAIEPTPATDYDEAEASGSPFSWRQSPFRSRRGRGD